MHCIHCTLYSIDHSRSSQFISLPLLYCTTTHAVLYTHLAEVSNENRENLPVGRRQLLDHEADLAHAHRLTLVLHRRYEAVVQLVGHQRLGELAQVLLDGAGQGLGLPLLGVSEVNDRVAWLGVNGLAEQALHLGDNAADAVETLQTLSYLHAIQRRLKSQKNTILLKNWGLYSILKNSLKSLKRKRV